MTFEQTIFGTLRPNVFPVMHNCYGYGKNKNRLYLGLNSITCTYQGVKNFSFSEIFVNGLNK